MLYATAPVIHRKGVSAAEAMAAVTGNATDKTGTVATANITVTANTAVIAAMVIITDNMNMVATAIIMSTTKATVVTKSANTVVTAGAEKGFAACLIMAICVL